MSELSPKVPRPEEPAGSDAQTEALEKDTLDKQAKSAAYRDAHERKQHLASLNERIGVLQDKLDKREAELQVAMPRIAELEQATKTSRLATISEVLGVGGGAILLSIAAYADSDIYKLLILGLGIGSSAIGLFSKLIYATWGWPTKKTS